MLYKDHRRSIGKCFRLFKLTQGENCYYKTLFQLFCWVFFTSYAFCCAERASKQSVLHCNYQDPVQLLQGAIYQTEQLLIRNGSFIRNISVYIGYIVNIRSLQKSHWVSKGFACLPNTADYQNHIVLFTSTLKLKSFLYSWLIPPKSINQITLGEIHLCRWTMQVLHNTTKYDLKTILDLLVYRDQNLQPVD